MGNESTAVVAMGFAAIRGTVCGVDKIPKIIV